MAGLIVRRAAAASPPWQLAAAAAAAALPRLPLARFASEAAPSATSSAAGYHSSQVDIPQPPDPDTYPPDVQPDPGQPRRNPDIYPGDSPDFPTPTPPAPDIYPRYPQPDIPPGRPDFPSPDQPGRGPYMSGAFLAPSTHAVGGYPQHTRPPTLAPCWHQLGGHDPGRYHPSVAGEGSALLRSPLFSWPAQLPLLKTDGGNRLAEAARLFPERC